jgi:hypothetical protein
MFEILSDNVRKYDRPAARGGVPAIMVDEEGKEVGEQPNNGTGGLAFRLGILKAPRIVVKRVGNTSLKS